MAPEKEPAECFLDEEDEGYVYADKDAVDDDVAEHEAAHCLVVGEYHVSEHHEVSGWVWRQR